MATSYMKLPYEERVLRSDSLRRLRLPGGEVGATVDVRLNYYRGMPLSAIERLELSIDGERVPDHLILVGLREKLFPPEQVPLAFSEHWPIKRAIRLHIYNGGIAAGEHDVELILHVRNVYMQFAPGVWGMIDSSSSRRLELGDAA